VNAARGRPPPVARALLSVSDKTGVVAFARGLRAAGVEILSTGGTARALREGGVEVRDVSSYTGYPEIMDGRVKTLHPRVHGGLLGRRGEDDAVMAEHGIAGIDLLAVNLYPFERTVARGARLAEAVENVDIGGPAMVRAAAKNHRFVTVVTNPADYDEVLGLIRDHGGVGDIRRLELAAAAFSHTAAYDRAIASWFAGHRAAMPRTPDAAPQKAGTAPQTPNAAPQKAGTAPQTPNAAPQKAGAAPQVTGVASQAPGAVSQKPGVAPQAAGVASQTPDIAPQTAATAPQKPGTESQMPDAAPQTPDAAPPPDLPQAWGGFPQAARLRYGENPHQIAALYSGGGGLAGAEQLQGKQLSFNNYLDADAAVRAVCEFADRPACVIVKHANPCGAACADSLAEAWRRARQTDPQSAFGGIVAVNRALDANTARALAEQFVEVVVAPQVAPDALSVLAAKPALRVLAHDAMFSGDAGLDARAVAGGVLVQQADTRRVVAADLKTVTRRKPDERETADLLFAWRVVKHVRSNAIVLAAEERTSGIGAGQMSRVDSVRLAVDKAARAGCTLTGAALASDAFFPFDDGLVAAHEAGIGAVIQPGGSVNDRKIIAAADERGMAMVFTGVRHFRH